MQRPAVEPIAVSRSYVIVSTRGTRGNVYQRLLVFTTARRKAPRSLVDPVVARYQSGRRARSKRAWRAPPGDGAGPVDCVTITIPLAPASRVRGATPSRSTNAAWSEAPRRP
jgi:hypothetical protein